MVVDSPKTEPAEVGTRKSEKLARQRRFEETQRRLQQLVANGELKFDPNGVEEGTNDPRPEIAPNDNTEAVTRLRNEYLRRSHNA